MFDFLHGQTGVAPNGLAAASESWMLFSIPAQHHLSFRRVRVAYDSVRDTRWKEIYYGFDYAFRRLQLSCLAFLLMYFRQA